MIIIIIILLLRSCSADGGNSPTAKPDLENAEYVQPDEVPDTEHVEGTTEILVISDFTVSKKYLYATLFNPESNSGYVKWLYHKHLFLRFRRGMGGISILRQYII